MREGINLPHTDYAFFDICDTLCHFFKISTVLQSIGKSCSEANYALIFWVHPGRMFWVISRSYRCFSQNCEWNTSHLLLSHELRRVSRFWAWAIEVYSTSWRSLYSGFHSTTFQCKVQRLVAGKLPWTHDRLSRNIAMHMSVNFGHLEPFRDLSTLEHASGGCRYAQHFRWKDQTSSTISHIAHGWERRFLVFDDIHIRYNSGKAKHGAA